MISSETLGHPQTGLHNYNSPRHETTQHCSIASDLDSKFKFPNTVFNYHVNIKDLENKLKVQIFQFATHGLLDAPTEIVDRTQYVSQRKLSSL